MQDRIKIFIAVPSKSGAVRIETSAALMAETTLMGRLNWEWMLRARVGDSYIQRSRNLLVGEFIRSDSTHMFMLDDDVGCGHGDMIRLISRDLDICGGTYLVKDDAIRRYPMRWLGNKVSKPDETGLLEVDGLPGGFFVCKRAAIEKMIQHRKDTALTLARLSMKLGVPEDELERAGLKEPVVEFHDDLVKVTAWDLFDTVLMKGGYEGEDYTFFRRAKAAGIRLWLDTALQLVHVGEKAFHGCLAEDLAQVEQDKMTTEQRVAKAIEDAA